MDFNVIEFRKNGDSIEGVVSIKPEVNIMCICKGDNIEQLRYYPYDVIIQDDVKNVITQQYFPTFEVLKNKRVNDIETIMRFVSES